MNTHLPSIGPAHPYGYCPVLKRVYSSLRRVCSPPAKAPPVLLHRVNRSICSTTPALFQRCTSVVPWNALPPMLKARPTIASNCEGKGVGNLRLLFTAFTAV